MQTRRGLGLKKPFLCAKERKVFFSGRRNQISNDDEYPNRPNFTEIELINELLIKSTWRHPRCPTGGDSPGGEWRGRALPEKWNCILKPIDRFSSVVEESTSSISRPCHNKAILKIIQNYEQTIGIFNIMKSGL